MQGTDPKWDATAPVGHWLASQYMADATSKVPFRIDGWLAAHGTSVWFGAGSTGKTQLLLWMAATIASTARPATWLGRSVGETGHVLILTAEDSREQIIGRIVDIVRNTLGQDGPTAEETCSRLHVMPFLSMTEDEFKHPNASLMDPSTDKSWQPSAVMLEIRRYIEDWNARNEVRDQIVGVIMDSATSMAGFDTIDGFATTNFFFYLGRLCEKLRLFWTVIGHQPKSVTIPKDTRLNAAARLRGAAMWTTAPRMTVEVRLLQEWKNQNSSKKAREAEHIRSAYPDRHREDFVVVFVAKANLPGIHTEERYLLRSSKGAFEDVTEAQSANELGCTVADDGAGANTKIVKPARNWTHGTSLVAEAIRQMFPNATSGDIVAAGKVLAHCKEQFAGHPHLELVQSAHGGKMIAAREGSINWHLDRLVALGNLTKDDRFFRFAAWNAGDHDTTDCFAQTDTGVG